MVVPYGGGGGDGLVVIRGVWGCVGGTKKIRTTQSIKWCNKTICRKSFPVTGIFVVVWPAVVGGRAQNERERRDRKL